jgi:hypothetical protein
MPLSAKAKDLLKWLRSQYEEDDYPEPANWSIRAIPERKAAFAELRARGLVEMFVADSHEFCMTQEGMAALFSLDDASGEGQEATLRSVLFHQSNIGAVSIGERSMSSGSVSEGASVPALDGPMGAGFELLCALDVAYEGTAVMYTMSLIFGELGRMANEEPGQFAAMLYGIERSSRFFMSDTDHEHLVALSRQLMEACEACNWQSAGTLATKLEGMIKALQYVMAGRKQAAFALGVRLRRWDMSTLDERVPKGLKESLTGAAERLAPGGVLAAELGQLAEKYLDDADSMASGQLPRRAYNLVRTRLLDEAMSSPGA